MTRIILTVIISYYSFSSVICQEVKTIFPKGIYMSYEELRNLKPSCHYNIAIKRRPISEREISGGYDYKIISLDGKINKMFIKKEIYAISTGDSLFINGFQFGFQYWYSYAESTDGIHLFFQAGAPRNNSDVVLAGAMFGVVGAAIVATKEATNRYTYVIDLKDERVYKTQPH